MIQSYIIKNQMRNLNCSSYIPQAHFCRVLILLHHRGKHCINLSYINLLYKLIKIIQVVIDSIHTMTNSKYLYFKSQKLVIHVLLKGVNISFIGWKEKPFLLRGRKSHFSVDQCLVDNYLSVPWMFFQKDSLVNEASSR